MWKWIHDLGVPGLLLLGILDNAPFLSTPAGGVDAIVILLAWHNRGWWAFYALMAIVGEVIGGYLTYRFAEKSGEETLEKKFGKARVVQVYKWFERRGTGGVVMVGAILPPPFPYTPVLTAAGVMHYPKSKFLPALVVGRSVRFFLVAYLGASRYRFLCAVLSTRTVCFDCARYTRLHNRPRLLQVVQATSYDARIVIVGWMC